MDGRLAKSWLTCVKLLVNKADVVESIRPELAHYVGYQGRRFRIYAYREPSGRILVTTRLAELKRRFHHIEKAYHVRWRRIAEDGAWRMKGDHHHKWPGRGFAHFKDIESKTRIPYFHDGAGILIMTHVIENKKEDDLDAAEVRETCRIRDEYFERKAALEQPVKRADAKRKRRQ